MCNYNTFFTSLQSLFSIWLVEKEEALNEVKTSNFKDSAEINMNVRQLAVSITPVCFGCWHLLWKKYVANLNFWRCKCQYSFHCNE